MKDHITSVLSVSGCTEERPSKELYLVTLKINILHSELQYNTLHYEVID